MPYEGRFHRTSSRASITVPGLPGVALVDTSNRPVLLTDSGMRVVDERFIEGSVSRVAASPSGAWFALGTGACRVMRWRTSADAADCRIAWSAHRDEVLCLAVDEDSGGIFSTGKDGQAVWQPGHGQSLRWTGDGGWMEQCASPMPRRQAGAFGALT